MALEQELRLFINDVKYYHARFDTISEIRKRLLSMAICDTMDTYLLEEALAAFSRLDCDDLEMEEDWHLLENQAEARLHRLRERECFRRRMHLASKKKHSQ